MTLVATITTLIDLVVPAGTSIASTQFTLTPAAGGQSLVDNVPGASAVGASATFTVTAPGDYTVSVQALDAAGNPLGTPSTATANIPVPTTITIQVPGVVTLA